MKKTFLPILFLFLCNCHAFAQKLPEHLIEKSLEECINKSKATSEMTDCLAGANTKWEAEIDKYYKLLMNVLPGDSKLALEKSQAAWVKFRGLEFEAIPELYAGIPGSYQCPTFLEHKMYILKARAQELKAYYERTKDEDRILK